MPTKYKRPSIHVCKHIYYICCTCQAVCAGLVFLQANLSDLLREESGGLRSTDLSTLLRKHGNIFDLLHLRSFNLMPSPSLRPSIYFSAPSSSTSVLTLHTSNLRLYIICVHKSIRVFLTHIRLLIDAPLTCHRNRSSSMLRGRKLRHIL